MTRLTMTFLIYGLLSASIWSVPTIDISLIQGMAKTVARYFSIPFALLLIAAHDPRHVAATHGNENTRRSRVSARVFVSGSAALMVSALVVIATLTIKDRAIRRDQPSQVLLTVDELKSVIRISGLRAQGSPSTTLQADPFRVVPAVCHSAYALASPVEYRTARFEAMKEQHFLSGDADPDVYSVGEAVFQFSSKDSATTFVILQYPKWLDCSSRSLTVKHEGYQEKLTLSDPKLEADKLAGTLVGSIRGEESFGWRCEHILSAKSVYVVDVRLCTNGKTGEAQKIVDNISAKI